MRSASDHWHRSILAKVNEIRAVLGEILARLAGSGADANQKHAFEEKVSLLAKKTTDLVDYYGPGEVPPQLTEFLSVFTTWTRHRNDPQLLVKLAGFYDTVTRIAAYESDSLPSFKEFLDTFALDADLNTLVAELVTCLEDLLAKGSEELSAQIEGELHRILSAINAAKGKDLVDLTAWLDFTAKALTRLADKYLGFPFTGIALDGAKIAMKSKIQVLALYNKAEKEFAIKVQLPFLSGAQAKYPELPTNSEIDRIAADSAAASANRKTLSEKVAG